MNNDLDKYKGCLVGLAIGDCLGAPFEFKSAENIKAYFGNHELDMIDFAMFNETFPAGYYTDDTSMMICLAESLVEKGFDIKDQFDRYKKWLLEGYATPFGKDSYGVGQQTFKALRNPLLKYKEMDGFDHKAGGNGSLMRSAPIGLMYKDYKEIIEKSLTSSFVTHNYFMAGWCCAVLNLAIRLILEGYNKEEIPAKIPLLCDDLPEEIKEILETNFDLMENYHGKISGYSLDTLRIAFWSWQKSENYTDCIKKTILLGHDTDTFAAVAGSLAGSYYGYESIPGDWAKKLINGERIIELANRIFGKSEAK